MATNPSGTMEPKPNHTPPQRVAVERGYVCELCEETRAASVRLADETMLCAEHWDRVGERTGTGR